MDSSKSIVVDIGSGICKFGYSGEVKPEVFPSVVGSLKYLREEDHRQEKKLVGNTALRYKESLILEYPIERGLVKNWLELEDIIQNVFSELKVSPENHNILLTASPLATKLHREKVVEVIFEKFSTPATYIASPAVLSLHAYGITTGISVDCGAGICHAVPVYEGHPIQHAIVSLDFAGRDLDLSLARLMNNRGFSFTTTTDLEIVRDIKERFAFVAFDFEQEMANSTYSPEVLERSYTLPDGRVITVGNEQFCCSESLFHPIFSHNDKGIHEIVQDSITKCDKDLIKEFFGHILLTGGTSMMPGLTERMKKEMMVLAPSNTKVDIIAPAERMYAAWIGGSILSSLTTFSQMLISADEYNGIQFDFLFVDSLIICRDWSWNSAPMLFVTSVLLHK